MLSLLGNYRAEFEMSVKSLNSQAKTCMDCASLLAYSLVFKMLLTKQCKLQC